jgi:hypothetical protein
VALLDQSFGKIGLAPQGLGAFRPDNAKVDSKGLTLHFFSFLKAAFFQQQLRQTDLALQRIGMFRSWSSRTNR